MFTVLCLRKMEQLKPDRAAKVVLMRAGKLRVLLASRGFTMKSNKVKRAACTCTICCYLVCFSKSHFFVLVFLACNFSGE